MKKILLILSFLLLLPFVKGQTIKRVKDKHIVGQEKRQVFYQWGDWQPEPKYFLGIQTNYAYAMVWGWLAPSRNRDYKGGNDIRPLGLAGLQNQRYATTLLQQDKTSDIQVNTLVASYHKIQRLTGTFVRGGETGLRLYSELECKRLMGFPDDFKVPVSRTQMYRQFGNSVAVPVIKAVADEMKTYL